MEKGIYLAANDKTTAPAYLWRGRRLSGRRAAASISLWFNFQEAFIAGDGTKMVHRVIFIHLNMWM